MIYQFTVFFSIFFLASASSFAQHKAEVDTTDNCNAIIYPVIFYLPETSFAFGSASVITFRLPGENYSSRPSSLNAGAAYTLNKQLLIYFPYKIFKDQNKWILQGELGYYIYLYNHFGIGNESSQTDEETYDVTYPRIHTALSRKCGQVYLGIKTRYDNYDITRIKENGLLENDPWAARGGGQIFSYGPIIQYDTKDFEFHPTSGWFAELSSVTAINGILSDANTYTKVKFEISKYFSLKDNHIIATNVYAGQIFGDAPFSELFFVGTDKRSRGMSNRRFKDNALLAFQSEYRFPIWNWVEGVAFGSGSVVSDELPQVLGNKIRYTGGAGVRFVVNRQDRVRVRIDYAISDEGSNSYLTINHAF